VPLTKERIVRTAMRLLNDVGVEGLTLRALAKELDVQAPALYWHFKSKRDLLDELATTIMRDMWGTFVPPDDLRWDAWVTESARRLRSGLLAYRDGAKVFAGTYVTDDSLFAAMEDTLRRLTRAGFTLRDAVQGYSTVYSYTIGFTIEEQGVTLEPGGEPDERYDLDRRDQRIDRERYPLALAAGKEVFGTSRDERFAYGLELIVFGLRRKLDADPIA
jgi:TetR/AcrR family transcriptional regulator, tetracycline repressor protein